MEVNQDNNSLATKLADAVIPALLSALGATARERKIRKESEIDDEMENIFDGCVLISGMMRLARRFVNP